MATFQINYAFQGTENKKRSGSLILNAKDRPTAIKDATSQLNKNHDWFKLTACKELDSTQTLV